MKNYIPPTLDNQAESTPPTVEEYVQKDYRQRASSETTYRGAKNVVFKTERGAIDHLIEHRLMDLLTVPMDYVHALIENAEEVRQLLDQHSGLL